MQISELSKIAVSGSHTVCRPLAARPHYFTGHDSSSPWIMSNHRRRHRLADSPLPHPTVPTVLPSYHSRARSGSSHIHTGHAQRNIADTERPRRLAQARRQLHLRSNTSHGVLGAPHSPQRVPLRASPQRASPSAAEATRRPSTSTAAVGLFCVSGGVPPPPQHVVESLAGRRAHEWEMEVQAGWLSSLVLRPLPDCIASVVAARAAAAVGATNVEFGVERQAPPSPYQEGASVQRGLDGTAWRRTGFREQAQDFFLREEVIYLDC
eukprot:SAG11_NODE_5980_length_1419_cov_1.888636_2_plen_266_part_00